MTALVDFIWKTIYPCVKDSLGMMDLFHCITLPLKLYWIIHLRWKVWVDSPFFTMIANLERSFWQNLKTNTKGERIGERRVRERTASELRNSVQLGRRRLFIALKRDNDDYHDVSDEHDSNKRLWPSIFTGGRHGCEEWSLLSRALYLRTTEHLLARSMFVCIAIFRHSVTT